MPDYHIERLPLVDILRLEVRETPSLTIKGERVCVTGGRDYEDRDTAFQRLNLHRATFGLSELGVGCATGLDAFALEWAEENGIAYKRYVADWDAIGTAAGSIRNGVMLEDFQPDRLLVFPGGTGTTDCTRKARKMGIPRTFISDELDVFAAAAKWG